MVGDGEIADPLLHVVDVLRYPALLRTGDDLPEDLAPDDHVVIVSSDLARVRQLARAAVLGGCAYVGIAGPAALAARIVMNLKEAGVPEDALRRVSAPAGLDLGAATAGETAVAIAAELVMALSGTLPPRRHADERN